ncbi:MAG TPA: ATP-binding protein [Aggregatilineales bacterium]|nr:ATP-binding protein [Anaerolineales bacterium]HRE48088.1 ATP-binding protein [Aggregatilineales bacterium]
MPVDWLANAREKNKTDRPAENLGESLSLFTPDTPRRRLADLVVSAATEAQLRTALAKIKHHDQLYHEWGLAAIHPEGRGIAINLYGAPGTGKSFAAEGIAEHLGRPILRIDYAQLESRFVGDTPKNIVAAFEAARLANAVLFFDEADSVLSRRVTNITQAADYGVNISRSTLLLQLDQFEGVVLFATNLAANYDPAFVRRILAHVHFAPPDADALIRLWRYHLPAALPLTPEVTPEGLAALSEGLCGGDILNGVILAAAAAAERRDVAVSLADFRAALDQVRQAKHEVGQPLALSGLFPNE